jgi:hypothetical protein
MKRLAVLLITIAALATACQGNVFSLSVGDCFNDPDDLAEVSDVEIVDCGGSHDNEVYASYEMSDGDFPGRTAVQNDAGENCVAEFDPYVGTDYLSSSLDISALTPTDQSWDQGDREVVCFLFDLNGAQLTTSTKGTGI